MEENKPRLYGIKNSNRDYEDKETWGKNQFNSSFPASLACYMHSKELKAVYCKADKQFNRLLSYIGINDLYGVNPSDEKIYFSFETQYTPYQKYVVGSIPRNDLVIIAEDKCQSSIEIKLVALPDNSTCSLSEDQYGSEIVVRPDTIIYLACSFIQSYNDDQEAIKNVIGSVGDDIGDWSEPEEVIPYIQDMAKVIRQMVNDRNEYQIPIIMEPIWKTEGKSSKLADNCLDIFVWSNFGMLLLFMPKEDEEIKKISRHTRTMIWLFKMLKDYGDNGKFDGAKIIDALSYNVKNDKAFSSNGSRTHHLMESPELRKPRIKKGEIKKIILGGGQNLLSPERRFDAIIFNSPDLFKEDSEC